MRPERPEQCCRRALRNEKTDCVCWQCFFSAKEARSPGAVQCCQHLYMEPEERRMGRRRPPPNPRNLTWQEGFCRCDLVKDLELEAYPGLSPWAQSNHKELWTMKAGRQRSRGQNEELAGFKMQRGTTSQGIWEENSPPSCGRNTPPYWHLKFCPVKPIL